MAAAAAWRRAAPAAFWTWRTLAELSLAGALWVYWRLMHAPWGLRDGRLLRRFDAVGRGDRATPAAREVVLFASGNRAMGSFLRNWGTSVERLGRGLSWWLVPLDQAGYDDLASDAGAQWPLLHDASGTGNFTAERGAVRCVRWATHTGQREASISCYHLVQLVPSVVLPLPRLCTPTCAQGRRLHAHGTVQVGRRGMAAAQRA